MSLKLRLIVGAILALTLGSIGGERYAAAAAPYYAYVARLIAHAHPWQIVTVELTPPDAKSVRVLRLIGQVRRDSGDQDPSATVVQKLQVGEVVEAFAVFWPMLLLWPAASTRQRLLLCLLGIPVFLILEAATTGVQLLHSLPQASAMLNGETDPVTPWERYSRFLEAGGRFVLEVCAVLLTVGAAKTLRFSDSKTPSLLPRES
jgi:hypothetical protein